jgi:endonuclease YncB( thermonuclease family)
MVGIFRFIFWVLGRQQPPAEPLLPPLRDSQPDGDIKLRVPLVVKSRARTAAELKSAMRGLLEVKVTYVKDGDSVIVCSRTETYEIRLDSIDCPEDGQPWGENARAGLIKLIGGKWLRVEPHGLDPYGRTLATVFVASRDMRDWINVNERMVMLGHAWVMRRYYDHLPSDRKRNLNRIENWAKSKKVGLWGTSNPIPPWHWRSQLRNGQAD